MAKIRNRTSHAILLYSLDGESVQVNPSATVNVDEKFLVDFDRLKIQVLDKTSTKRVLSTDAVTAEPATDLSSAAITADAKASPKKKAATVEETPAQ